MKLVSHFTRELKQIGLYDTSSRLTEAVMGVAKSIDDQDLTDYDMLKCKIVLEKLIKQEPLTPLTGDEDEWISDDETWDKNLRCPRVFREKSTGNCYDIHGRMFIKNVDGKQVLSTNKDSHVLIKFPYTPKTEYIHISDNK